MAYPNRRKRVTNVVLTQYFNKVCFLSHLIINILALYWWSIINLMICNSQKVGHFMNIIQIILYLGKYARLSSKLLRWDKRFPFCITFILKKINYNYILRNYILIIICRKLHSSGSSSITFEQNSVGLFMKTFSTISLI